MLLDLHLTEPPASRLMDVAHMRRHLKVSVLEVGDDELTDLIGEVGAVLDGYSGLLGRALITQTWTWYLPCFRPEQHPAWRNGFFPAGLLRVWPERSHQVLRIPLPPLQMVGSIAYVDQNGDSQTLDPSTYVVIDGPRSEIRLAPQQLWPSTQYDNPRAVTIVFTSGYGDAIENVPPPLFSAMKFLAGHLYRNREAVVGVDNRDSSTEIPLGFREQMANYRASNA